jgi:tRNA-splicing ligase RtcB
VQRVAQVFDAKVVAVSGVREGDVVVSIHCGSRGLGHQIGTEYLKDRRHTSCTRFPLR